jgi:hypothetical protein
MAGSAAVFTETTFSSVKKVVCAWTADDATGAVSGTTSAVYDGKLIGLSTVPAAAGDAPTDYYDVTVTDVDGWDVLLGAGADREPANTEHVAEASLGAAAGSKLTVNVTNAGNSKKGTVILWIR